MEGKNESKHTPVDMAKHLLKASITMDEMEQLFSDNTRVWVDWKYQYRDLNDRLKQELYDFQKYHDELIASAPALLEENENLKWKCSIWEPKINELTEEVDVWRKKADAEEIDAKKWYKKYNEMSEIAFGASNREYDLRAEVDRLTQEKSELVEIVEQFIKNIKHVDGGYLYLKVKLRNKAQDLLTRIK